MYIAPMCRTKHLNFISVIVKVTLFVKYLRKRTVCFMFVSYLLFVDVISRVKYTATNGGVGSVS